MEFVLFDTFGFPIAYCRTCGKDHTLILSEKELDLGEEAILAKMIIVCRKGCDQEFSGAGNARKRGQHERHCDGKPKKAATSAKPKPEPAPAAPFGVNPTVETPIEDDVLEMCKRKIAHHNNEVAYHTRLVEKWEKMLKAAEGLEL